MDNQQRSFSYISYQYMQFKKGGFMKYKIPCTENLYITDQFTIEDSFGNQLQLINNEYVDIVIQNTRLTAHVQWLYLYARFNFPEYINIDDIKFYQLPNFREELPWRPLFLKPYWFDETHRIVPMCPSIAIDSHGHAINVYTGTVYTPSYSEYLIIEGYKPQYNKYAGLRVHLLVANAWILENQNSTYPICNHKDGNKYNPDVSNLEWVTYKENALHAVNSGLINYTVSCRIRHIVTGDVLEFPSVKQAAEYLNIKAAHLYKESQNLNHLINGVYELRLEGDNRPWLYTNESNVVNQATSRYIISVVEPDGKQYTFNGVGAFIAHYNLTQDNYIVPLSKCRQIFKLKYPAYSLNIQDQHNTNMIQVLDITTNYVSIHSSVAEVMSYTKLSKGIVHYALKANGHMIHDKYRIRYISNEPWPTTLPKYAKIKLNVFDKLDGSTRTYSSLSQLERETGIARKVIKRIIKSPNESDRYMVTEERSETSACT